MKKIIRQRLATAGIVALSAFGLVVAGPVGTANAARQSSLLHGVSSERASMLVFHSWNCTNGAASDFVRRGDYAELSVGSIWLAKDYSLWLDTRPGPGTNWTRWASRSTSRSRCISMASMPVTRSQFILRRGNSFYGG